MARVPYARMGSREAADAAVDLDVASGRIITGVVASNPGPDDLLVTIVNDVGLVQRIVVAARSTTATLTMLATSVGDLPGVQVGVRRAR